MTMDVNDLLSGGEKIPGARFDKVGDSVTGTIVSAEARQTTDIQTGQPEVWPQGDPKMQVVITLQTDQRDPEIEGDDGRRRLYAKKPSAMLTAIIAALAGNRLEVGGRLAVQHTGTEPASTRGFNDKKLYAAAYQPPAVNAAADLLAEGGAEGNGQPPADVSALL
jgi:hypothetical protein